MQPHVSILEAAEEVLSYFPSITEDWYFYPDTVSGAVGGLRLAIEAEDEAEIIELSRLLIAEIKHDAGLWYWTPSALQSAINQLEKALPA